MILLFTVTSIDKSTTVENSLLGPADISANQVHALCQRDYLLHDSKDSNTADYQYCLRTSSRISLSDRAFRLLSFMRISGHSVERVGYLLPSAEVATVMPITTAKCGKQASRQF